MGFDPRTTGRMSFWELAACAEAWRRAQGGEDEPPAIDEDDYADLLAKQL